MGFYNTGERYQRLFERIAGRMAAQGVGMEIRQVVEALEMDEEEIRVAQEQGLMPKSSENGGEESTEVMFPEHIHRLWVARQMYSGVWGSLSKWTGNWKLVMRDLDMQMEKPYGFEFFRNKAVHGLIEAMAGMVGLEE